MNSSSTQSKLFFAVAGNIGSGKSSLTTKLSELYGWKAYYESVDDNPYLPDFYSDMKRWAFHLQVYFLSKRFQNHKHILESPDSVIQDRSIYEDVEIFARNLYEIGKMDERDYDNYTSLFTAMSAYLKPPDLMIYLKCSVETLIKQIKRRGRSFEQSIPREYLEQLNRHYERWIASYSIGPVLVVENNNLDFVHQDEDLKHIAGLIERKMESHIV
jgi:deoxyadenosine/deoxycytidine kinase